MSSWESVEKLDGEISLGGDAEMCGEGRRIRVVGIS